MTDPQMAARMRTAVAIATAALAIHDDKAAGRDYDDLVGAMLPDLQSLFADGPILATLALLRLVDLAVSHSAMVGGCSRAEEWQVIAASALMAHADDDGGGAS